MTGTTVALVGTTGGAGTTRTCVELTAMLARAGRDAALLDAAYATQGLAAYVDGRIRPDATALTTDAADEPLAAGLREFDLPTEGRAACCPARAPFERLARAKAPDAARAFERRMAEAAESFDHALVDVPPVAANQSVAAVTAADRVALVTPGTPRGRDARQRARERLADLGVEPAATIAVGGEIEAADAVVPETEATAPACLGGDAFARAVAGAAGAAVGDELGVAFEEEGLLSKLR